jgi:hypothetical protein
MCLCIYVVWPAQAFAMALLRVVHAVPGAGAATLDFEIGSRTLNLGPVAFAHASGFDRVPAGPFKWALKGGGKTLATGTGRIGNGAYTGVLMFKGSGMKQMGVMLHLYRDHAGEAGKTLIRVIHSAPEFGSPSLQFDSKTVAKSLDFMHATPYLTVPPGVHSLGAMAPGRASPVLSLKGVRLVGGVAYSEIVVGTRGQRVRVVTVTDRGAPLSRPAAKHSPMPAPHGARWVTVRPGDSLWKIAARRCARGASGAEIHRELVQIWNANVRRIGTGDPNLIFPGQRLHMPPKS